MGSLWCLLLSQIGTLDKTLTNKNSIKLGVLWKDSVYLGHRLRGRHNPISSLKGDQVKLSLVK